MIGYGVMIRQWRNEKGWSQRELAKALGCSDGYIALIESASKVPSLDLCMTLIHTLQLRPQDEQALLDAVEDARRREADHRVRMRSAVARDVMRVEFCDKLPLDDFLKEIPAARRICILETFTDLANDEATYQAFTAAITAALHKGAEIQILLIDPDSYGAKQRAKELANSPTPITNVRELMDLTLARFYKLQSILEEDGAQNKLAIKLYDASPSIALHRWDHEAYISFFPVNQRSDNAPNLKISMLHRMGEYIAARFDELWHQKTSISLKSYMEMHVKINNNSALFYFKVDENKNRKTLYAVCKSPNFPQILNTNMSKNKTIHFMNKEFHHKGKFNKVTLNDEKQHVIKDIMKKYDWGEKDREHYIGNDPELFFIKLPNQSHI